ncbi:MAG: hypothetical protein RTU30_12755 [Candidatus Thorarchaeota archaeon]
MLQRPRALVILLSMLFILGLFIPYTDAPQVLNHQTSESLGEIKDITVEDTKSVLSETESTVEGYMNPISIEQIGYVTAGTAFARTDTNPFVSTNLTIDTEHRWMGSIADVSVWNLEKLYATNGSFTEGTPGSNLMPTGNVSYHPLGWDANSSRSGVYEDELQLAGYDTAGSQYIVVENQGGKVGQNAFGHTAGTNVVWSQYIENAPYTKDFLLSFDYLYLRGPLDGPDGLDPVVGNCSLQLLIDGISVWNISLLQIEQRGLWYDTGQIPIHVSSVSTSFLLEIGLVIDETLTLDKRYDYDGDPLHLADGIGNCAYITAFMDDVSFLKASPPDASQVELEFSTDGTTVPITGSAGVYNASITNETYWTNSPLSVVITANTSVSFNYEARLRSHRFSNSSWNSNPVNEGTRYSIAMHDSADITGYTYLGALEGYENLSFWMRYPMDWENATVKDPFLDDVTSQCMIQTGAVWVPSALATFENLGWWEISLESPNYAKQIEVQKDVDGDWTPSTILRTGNQTRASVTIGTSSTTLSYLDSVNVMWKHPNGTIEVQESLSGGFQGQINSTSWTLGGLNTTAGDWCVEVFWTNGSEIAYASTGFGIYHKAALEAVCDSFEVDSGTVVGGIVEYYDAENGEFLLDGSATIIANWSGVVVFDPIATYNHWQGNFDTDLVSAGIYSVLVNASRPYFDDVSCTFTIANNLIDNQLNLELDNADMDLYSTFDVRFRFEDAQGDPIEDADISITFDGTQDGIVWTEVIEDSPGNYTFEITSHSSGIYSVRIQGSKLFYESAEDNLFIIVGKLGTNLTLVNGTGGIVQHGENYNLVLRYSNSTDYGLENATISIVSITPETGISYSNISKLGNGYYSVVLTPFNTGTFTILLQAEKINHREQIASFSLNVPQIASSLTLTASNTIAINQHCIVTLNFTSNLLGGIENATIGPVDPSMDLDFSELAYIQPGIYQISITPTQIGSYQIVFKASALNHLDATAALGLEVTVISTTYTLLGGLPVTEIEYQEMYSLDIIYESIDSGYNITDADIDITFASGASLSNRWTAIGEIYHIEILGNLCGSYQVSVHISKENHQDVRVDFTLQVTEVSTRITQYSFDSDLTYDHSTSLHFFYRFANNQTGITGASLSMRGVLPDWIEFIDLGTGNYSIIITPDEIAQFTATFTFSIENFVSTEAVASFTVKEIEVYLDGPAVIELAQVDQLILNLRLLESGTNIPVSGAIVTYSIYQDETPVDTNVMEELESDPGAYRATINVEWETGGGYRLNVTIEKQYHDLAATFNKAISIIYPEPPTPGDVLIGFVMDTLPYSLSSIALLTIGYVGYRNYRKRRYIRFLEAVVAKKRFDDADNIIGIIIMHSSSGVPIYSSTLKGGFEEGMVSAFISAITHFRSEFDDTTTDWEGEVIPISDIIRIVPTKHLICAFITVSPASMEQEAKMVQFAGAVGEFLDDQMEHVRSHVIDEKDAGILDSLFHTELDGYLLHYYKIGTSAQFPKQYRIVEQTLIEEKIHECAKPVHMAKKMMKYGKTEAEGCKLILESIDQELLIPCSHDEITVFASTDWSVFDTKDYPAHS